MRVSEKMIFESTMDRMQRQTYRLLKVQEQVSSGKKINRPSDDPIAQARVLNFENAIKTSDQYLRNIGQVESFMSASEAGLQTVQGQLVRVRELAVQMANATNTAADRAIAAEEVKQIYDQLVSVANISHAGRYIFGGNKTATQPFLDKGRVIGTALTLPVTITATVNDALTLTVDGISGAVTMAPGTYTTGTQVAAAVQTAINGNTTFSNSGITVTVNYDTDHLVIVSDGIGGGSTVSPTAGNGLSVLGLTGGTTQAAGFYLGDSGESRIGIGSNISVIQNLPGNRLFKGVSGGVDILSIVGSLQTALEANNSAGIQTALGNLNGAEDQISNERALLGARLNRTETSSSLLQDFKLTLQGLKSESEDVDLSRAISDLVQQQTLLEATRATAARLVQRSLLDFLR